MALCPEHPKRDQNPKFTPLSETTSIPVCFIWEFAPGAVPSPGETMEVEDPNSLREWRKGTATRRTVGYVKIRCVRKFQN